MMRRLLSFLVCFALLASRPAWAGEAMKDALASLPADAMAFICVPNLKQTDANYQQAVIDLGLTPMVQPPMNSLVGMIKEKFPMFAGLDENGTFAVVLMPAANLMELDSNMALVVPAADPKAMIEKMGGQANEGGGWGVNMFGTPSFAFTGTKRVIVAKSADVARKIAEGKGLDAKLKPADVKSLEGLDVAVWLDGERFLKVFKPQIDGLVGMVMMMQSAGGALGAKQAEATKQQIDMFREGAASLSFGVALTKAGLNLRFATTSKPGSEMAKQLKVKTTKESLLRGLPAEKYMVAFGQIVEPAQVKASMKSLDPYFGMLEAVEGIDKAKVAELKSVVEEWVPLLTGVRGVLESLPPGPNGLFGGSLIVSTEDSKKWLELTSKAVTIAKKLVADATGEKIDANLKKAVEAIAYVPDVEKIGDVSVCHLKLDLAKLDELDEEELADTMKVIGKEGVLVRLAPANANTVVVTFGGGSAYASRLLESARKNEAALDAESGIKKVSPHVVDERSMVMYVAVDQAIAGINSALKVAEEEALPVQIPTINAPLALSATGGDEWLRWDIYLPTELMVAGKNAGMSMMGGGGSASPAAAPAEKSK